MTIHSKDVEHYFTVVLLVFSILPQFVILENWTGMDLTLSGVKDLSIILAYEDRLRKTDL